MMQKDQIHSLHRWPNLLLLIGNIILALVSGGDGRIFVISIIVGILIRYAFLIFLIWTDWRRPSLLDRPWMRRMFRAPDEDVINDNISKDTPPLAGHLICLALYAGIPFFGLLKFFNEIPLWDRPGLTLLAISFMELRDLLTGQVLFFQPGSGHQRNADWNFYHIPLLMFVMLSLPVVIIPALGLLHLYGWITQTVFHDLQIQRIILWIMSGWIIILWQVLLARMDSRSLRRANS